MEIFKKPSELLVSLRNNMVSLKLLREEYKNKVVGEVFNKRHSYLTSKIGKARRELTEYCTVGTTKSVTLWELNIEREVRTVIINKKMRIYLDGRLDYREVTKLIEFNHKCIVHDIRVVNTIILGKTIFL